MDELMTKQAEIASKTLSIKEKADAMVVVDQASYDAAGALNKAARDERKAFHLFFDPIDEASKKQRAATIAQGKSIDDPLDYVIRITGEKQAKWFRAEQARIEAERRAEEDRRRKEAEEAQLAAAEQLASEGMTAAADEALAAPVVIESVKAPEVAKGEGVSYRTSYSAEVVSLMDLVKAVAAGSAPITMIEANMTTLNGWARLTKGTEAIPGVRIVKKDTQVVR
jgi:hypothetical protein